MFYHELLRKSVTSIGPTTLGTVKKVCVKDVFQSIICDPCDPCSAICFNLFGTTSIHSMRKNQKLRNSTEGDTEDSTVQGSKDRELSRKV